MVMGDAGFMSSSVFCRVWGHGQGLHHIGCVNGSWSRFRLYRCKVWGLGFRSWGLGFEAEFVSRAWKIGAIVP